MLREINGGGFRMVKDSIVGFVITGAVANIIIAVGAGELAFSPLIFIIGGIIGAWAYPRIKRGE